MNVIPKSVDPTRNRCPVEIVSSVHPSLRCIKLNTVELMLVPANKSYSLMGLVKPVESLQQQQKMVKIAQLPCAIHKSLDFQMVCAQNVHCSQNHRRIKDHVFKQPVMPKTSLTQVVNVRSAQ